MANEQTTFSKSENKEEKINRLKRVDENIVKTLENVRALYAVDDLEATSKLVSLLDELLKDDDWESSLLLRTTKKHLVALRDEAKQIVDKLSGGADLEANLQVSSSLEKDHIKIYISLYQSEGSNIKAWQRMLKSLANYSISRPVYNDEEQVREMIRSKPEIQRHAYAIVAIPQNGIIHLEKPTVDKFNHELLTLKEGAVQLKNIIEFVHANEKRYVFRDDKLILLK